MEEIELRQLNQRINQGSKPYLIVGGRQQYHMGYSRSPKLHVLIKAT